MNFDLTEDQKNLQQEVVDLAKNNFNEVGTLESFSKKSFKAAGEFGLFGINVDEKYGGSGESYLTSALVFEALGYACENNGLIFAINNHIWVGLNIINNYGSDDLKQKYLREMVDGNLIGSIAITESEAGSDATSMSTFAEKEGTSFILNGSKEFISNGPIADLFIVFAKTEPKTMKGITAFLVERNTPGLQVGRDLEKMGLKGCPTSEITFKDCKIPETNVIGRINFGTLILTEAMEWERCFEFAPHVGTMKRLMERSLKYSRQRQQFGQPIGENELISDKISRMKMSIEFSKLMLYKIATMKDQKKNTFIESSMFKLFVSEHYIQICRDALQIFGAYGYTTEYGLERELRDATASSIYSGTNEMQSNTIYKMIKNLI